MKKQRAGNELYYIPGVGSFAPELLGITAEDMERESTFDNVPSLDWLEEAVREKLERELADSTTREVDA